MANVVSVLNLNNEKKLALELEVEKINNEINTLNTKMNELCSQRNSLESKLYNSRERAEINIKRKSQHLKW